MATVGAERCIWSERERWWCAPFHNVLITSARIFMLQLFLFEYFFNACYCSIMHILAILIFSIFALLCKRFLYNLSWCIVHCFVFSGYLDGTNIIYNGYEVLFVHSWCLWVIISVFLFFAFFTKSSVFVVNVVTELYVTADINVFVWEMFMLNLTVGYIRCILRLLRGREWEIW